MALLISVWPEWPEWSLHIMFKFDSIQKSDKHLVLISTTLQKGIFERFWALKHDLLCENVFKCGQLGCILKALICAVIMIGVVTKKILEIDFFSMLWTPCAPVGGEAHKLTFNIIPASLFYKMHADCQVLDLRQVIIR